MCLLTGLNTVPWFAAQCACCKGLKARQGKYCPDMLPGIGQQLVQRSRLLASRQACQVAGTFSLSTSRWYRDTWSGSNQTLAHCHDTCDAQHRGLAATAQSHVLHPRAHQLHRSVCQQHGCSCNLRLHHSRFASPGICKSSAHTPHTAHSCSACSSNLCTPVMSSSVTSCTFALSSGTSSKLQLPGLPSQAT